MEDKANITSSAQLKGFPGVSWWWLVTVLAVGLLIGIGSLQLVSLVARPIALFILGIALGFTLAPVVNWLERWLGRTTAVILVFVLLVVIFVVLGMIVFPPMIVQFREIGARIPRIIERIQEFLSAETSTSQGAITTSLLAQIGSFAGTLVRAPVVLFSSLLDFLLIIFVAIYWLISLPAFTRFCLSLFPEKRHPRLRVLFRRMGIAMGGYLRGVAINGLVMGVLVYVGLMVMHVDYPVALAVLTAVLELIPVLGPLLAGIIIVITALTQSTTLALAAGLYMLVMQQLEGHILVPNIIKAQTDTSSLVVLLALFIGNHIGGLIGGIAAVPLVSALQVLFKDALVPAIRRWTGAEPAQLPPPADIPPALEPPDDSSAPTPA